MNIEEYRALKAQEEAQKAEGATDNAQTQPTTTEPVNPSPQANESGTTSNQEGTEGTAQTGTGETETIPTKVSIEGVGEVDLEELKKGYLRQSDYTKKTQEVAQKQRELQRVEQLYQKVQSNPERAQELAKEFDVPTLDPNVDYVTKLQENYYDLLLEKEINSMKDKYPDFDAHAVLEVARDRKLENLEEAYQLHKVLHPTPTQPIDVDSIKEQIRQELLKELELERNTQSIIGTTGGGNPTQTNAPVLSEAELRVAKNMNMTPDDYAKWRDK